MGLEAAVEQGLKTAFRAYTDTLTPDAAVKYRCFFLDDESESGARREELEYPYIAINASPSYPHGHKSVFHDVSVEVKWATHDTADAKQATLRSLYEACRAILDAETGITITGYSLMGVIINEGGDVAIEDNVRSITLPITVKVCGA